MLRIGFVFSPQVISPKRVVHRVGAVRFAKTGKGSKLRRRSSLRRISQIGGSPPKSFMFITLSSSARKTWSGLLRVTHFVSQSENKWDRTNGTGRTINPGRIARGLESRRPVPEGLPSDLPWDSQIECATSTIFLPLKKETSARTTWPTAEPTFLAVSHWFRLPRARSR